MSSSAWAKELRKNLCHYCGRFPGTVDHKTPRSRGGSNGPENCVSCCPTCNNLKDTMPYEKFIELIRMREASIAACTSQKDLKAMCPRCGCKNPERKHSPKYPVNQRNCRVCGLRYYPGSIFRAIASDEFPQPIARHA